MGEIRSRKADPNFVPNEEHMNALKAFLIGTVEEQPDIGSHGMPFPVYPLWLRDNLYRWRSVTDELYLAGLMYDYEWYDRQTEWGLTEAGIAILEQHFNKPNLWTDFKGFGYDVFEAWVRETVLPGFRRKGQPKVAKPTGKAATVTNTTTLVSQLSYTPEEAEAERARLTTLVEAGQMNRFSARAYKANITRRTQKAA